MTVSTTHLAGALALSLLLAPATAPAAAPTGRFAPSGGVVLDKKTGLSWQQAATSMAFTWANAVTYCSGNVAALPGSGWRLPTIKELQTLVDDSVGSPTIDASAFPSMPGYYFWSSTSYASSASSTAWLVDFNIGNTFNADMTSAHNVRCVR